MKTFHFKGDMADHFGPKAELHVKSFREAIDALDVNFKGFRKFLLKKQLNGIQYNIIADCGTDYTGSALDLELKHKDYHIIPKAGGSAGMNLLGMIGQFAMGFGMEWLTDKLNPVEETGKEYEIITTNSYLYTQNENTVEQGRPVPIVYGMLRIGSLVVNSTINNYDYDYDMARIYPYPANINVNQGGSQVISQRILNNGVATATYSFIEPNDAELVNLRNQPGGDRSDEIRPYNASDPTRRTMRINGTAQAKPFQDDAGNSSYNHDFKSSAGEGGMHKTYGPSVNNAQTLDGGGTTVGGGQGSRPFLFPNVNHIDGDMRPNSANDSCGVRVRVNNGVEQRLNISYRGAAQNSFMRVGSRGNYQKLESIGIYKAVDILCEGPIEGLGNPIAGFAPGDDVGLTNFPVGRTDIQIDMAPGGTNGISVETLSFDVATNHFVGNNSGGTNLQILCADNTNPCTNLADGNGDYTNTPDGTYAITADNNVDPASNVSIRVTYPTSALSASLDDFSFSEYVLTQSDQNVITDGDGFNNIGYAASSNGNLFLCNRANGSIVLNNNEQGAFGLNANLVQSGIAQLNLLEQNNTALLTSFRVGQGYGSAGFTRDIPPPNGVGDFTLNFQACNPYTRKSQATLADGSSVLDFNTILENRITQLYNTTANSIPGSNFGWGSMCRIQIDGNGLNDNQLATNVYIDIGSASMFNGTMGGFFNRTRQFSNRNIFLRVTAGELLGMARINNVRTTRTFYVQNGAAINDGNATAYNGNRDGGSNSLGTWDINTNTLWNAQAPNGMNNTSWIQAFQNDGAFELGALFAYGNGGAANFSDRATNAITNYTGTALPRTTLGANDSFKFVPGSGSNQTQQTKVTQGGAFFNVHMVRGNFNNLNALQVTNAGNATYNNADGVATTAPFGFYHPKLNPRIYVSVIRRYRNSQGDIQWQVCRTNIDAVVRVNGNGLVDGAFLLDVDDLCVWDPISLGLGQGGQWTAIQPQDINRVRPIHTPGPTMTVMVGNGAQEGPTRYQYQDVGLILKVDSSTSAQTIKFDINANGTISNNFAGNQALRREMHSVYTNFGDHVVNNLEFASNSVAAGMIPDTWTGGWGTAGAANRILRLDRSNNPNDPPPTTFATVNVGIETINLANTRLNNRFSIVQNGHGSLHQNPPGNFICTGRPIDRIVLTNAGAGYTGGLGAQIQEDLFNKGDMVTYCSVTGDRNTSNVGYRPNSSFYIIGTSTREAFAGIAGNAAGVLLLPFSNVTNAAKQWLVTGASLILEARVDDSGSISALSVVDGGGNFASGSEIGDITWLLPSDMQAVYEAQNQVERGVDASGNIWNRLTANFPGSVFAPNTGAIGPRNISNNALLDAPMIAPNAVLNPVFFLNVGSNLNVFKYEQMAFGTVNDPNHPTPNSRVYSFNALGAISPTLCYPKQNLILNVPGIGLGVNGEINQFNLTQNGLGFVPSNTILNPFSLNTSTPPVFNVTFANGSLTAISIDTNSAIQGYSQLDTEVQVIFSAPPAPANVPVAPPNNAATDTFALYRSIYLNDVPIRDTNNRYNFSRFHFDMRIGNFRNGRDGNQEGTITSINENNINVNARGRILGDEFKVPSNTKIINYPLFGPRNHGEKDYYYSYTIKNPEVTDICITLKINQLHYIYEGDEEVVYINLVPILGAILGFFIGQWLISLAIKVAFPDPVVACGCICVGGATTGNPSSLGELAMAVVIGALVLAGGIIGAVLGFMIAKRFKCSLAPFLCFKVGNLIKNSGEIWPAKMKFAIEYGLEGQQLNQEIIEIAGCATNPYMKDVFINNLPLPEDNGLADQKLNRIFKIYRITREMDPVTGGLTEARYKMDAELFSISEYVLGFFNYPNTAMVGTRINSKDMPEIPRREFLVKGKLIRVPSNYTPAAPAGTRYQGNWPGQFQQSNAGVETLVWSSNPAWVIWDLLTNQRYGVGKYGITDDDLDRWSFYEFAQYCDEEVPVFIEGNETTERRHMCNLYIDSTRDAYEYIQDLLNLYNATLNFTGGKFYFIADMADQETVMLFNNSNITEEGFTYSSTPKTQRITACTVDYVDERDNYISKSEYVEDPKGVAEHGYSHIRVAGFGVTRKGEANRIAWQKILTKQMEKELVEFNAGIEASYLRVGDVIEVMDNNKSSLHAGGRIARIIANNQIELDIPSDVLNNVNRIKIRRSLESDEFNDNEESTNPSSGNTENRRSQQWSLHTITSRNGFNVTITPNLDNTVTAGFVWVIEDDTVAEVRPKQYRIKSIKEVSPLKYTITAIDYVAEKYERINNSASSRDAGGEEITEYYGPDLVANMNTIINSNPDARN